MRKLLITLLALTVALALAAPMSMPVAANGIPQFLTGGGKAINSVTGAVYTFDGEVGRLEVGTIVGWFKIVNHAEKESWYCSNTNFSYLDFRAAAGGDAGMPPATYPLVVFTGNFTSNKGNAQELTLVIADYGEYGIGIDKISIYEYPLSSGTTFWLGNWIATPPYVQGVLLRSGNFQMHEGYMTP